MYEFSDNNSFDPSPIPDPKCVTGLVNNFVWQYDNVIDKQLTLLDCIRIINKR